MKVCFCVNNQQGCWEKKGTANSGGFRTDFIKAVLELNHEEIYRVSQGGWVVEKGILTKLI